MLNTCPEGIPSSQETEFGANKDAAPAALEDKEEDVPDDFLHWITKWVMGMGIVSFNLAEEGDQRKRMNRDPISSTRMFSGGLGRAVWVQNNNKNPDFLPLA